MPAKPLEWIDEEVGDEGAVWWSAEVLGLSYQIRVTPKGVVRIREPDKGGWTTFVGNCDEAKAAFEADWQRRYAEAGE